MPEFATIVRDKAEKSRYEVFVDGQPAGFAAYRVAPGRVVFVHTEIDPSFAGRGVGSALVSGALEDVRRQDKLVTARCPFVAAYVRAHAEYGDLVEDRPGGQVGP